MEAIDLLNGSRWYRSKQTALAEGAAGDRCGPFPEQTCQGGPGTWAWRGPRLPACGLCTSLLLPSPPHCVSQCKAEGSVPSSLRVVWGSHGLHPVTSDLLSPSLPLHLTRRPPHCSCTHQACSHLRAFALLLPLPRTLFPRLLCGSSPHPPSKGVTLAFTWPPNRTSLSFLQSPAPLLTSLQTLFSVSLKSRSRSTVPSVPETWLHVVSAQ